MSTEEKLKLITRNLAETLTEEELKKLIESGTPLKHYIGFEISGKLHLGQLFGLMFIKNLHKAGVETTIWLADYHSAVNGKLGGDLEIIQKVANGYFKECMKVMFSSIGGDPEKLIFKLCSEEYAKNPDFWMTFIEVGRLTTLSRTKRSITIMGREASDDSMETANLMYPLMQAADIFLLQANIAHAGIDQRKVHVVAREAAMQIKTFPLKDISGNQIKPIAIHHPILLGLQQQEQATGEIDEIAMKSKMSKSKADSGVSVHDSEEEIKSKINSAFAPEGIIENNPILNWVKYLVFFEEETTFVINRPEKWGGNLTYTSFKDLEKDYADKKLHPQDLKMAVADWLIKTLEPVRKHFEDPIQQAALAEIEQLTQK